MQHEKIIKREDGTRYTIYVSFWESRITGHSYDVSVSKCAKGKRAFINIHSSDDYFWRRLDNEGREKYKMDLYLKEVSEEEIQQAKLELWEKLKP